MIKSKISLTDHSPLSLPNDISQMFDTRYNFGSRENNLTINLAREKRQNYFANGGKMSDIKNMLVSDRFFNLEDQKSAQACFYR